MNNGIETLFGGCGDETLMVVLAQDTSSYNETMNVIHMLPNGALAQSMVHI